MGVSGRQSRNNLVQVEIEGRSQSTIKNKNKMSSTVLIQRNKPIRYTLEELRQIKGKVDNINRYKIPGVEVCYTIRKLRLNRRPSKKKKLNKQEVKEERAVLKSNLIKNKNRKMFSPGYDKQKFYINTP